MPTALKQDSGERLYATGAMLYNTSGQSVGLRWLSGTSASQLVDGRHAELVPVARRDLSHWDLLVGRL